MSEGNTNNSKQAAWVAIGSFFSFIVGIVSPMILSRYFDKGDYGTYKQVMYVYNTLLAVFTLGLPKAYAYFLPKYPREYSKDIIAKVTKIFFVLGAIFSLFLFFCAGPIANVMKNPDLKLALMVFSPTPLLLLPTMGLDSIFATFKKTKYLTYYTIATKVFTIFCIVLPVICFHGNYIHAIIGFDVASLITCILALYLKTWPIKEEKHEKVDLSLKRIFDFAIPLLYASLWGMIIGSANQFFISRYYGNEVFAEFSNGFMEIPFVGMITGAISAILLPVFSGMDKGKGMSNETVAVWNSALMKSAKLVFPILVYSIFFAKQLMTCMYGDAYSQSTIYFQIKNFSGLFFIIPFYPIILAIGKTKEYARVHMIVAFVIVITEYIACKLFDSAVYIAIISESCQLLKIFLLMKVIADYSSKKILELLPPGQLGRVLSVALLSAIIPFLLVTLVDMNKFVALGVSFVLYIVCYYFICWISRTTYKDVVAGFIRNDKFGMLLRFIP